MGEPSKWPDSPLSYPCLMRQPVHSNVSTFEVWLAACAHSRPVPRSCGPRCGTRARPPDRGGGTNARPPNARPPDRGVGASERTPTARPPGRGGGTSERTPNAA